MAAWPHSQALERAVEFFLFSFVQLTSRLGFSLRISFTPSTLSSSEAKYRLSSGGVVTEKSNLMKRGSEHVSERMDHFHQRGVEHITFVHFRELVQGFVVSEVVQKILGKVRMQESISKKKKEKKRKEKKK